MFIKAFRQRMISCWHFTPIILVVVEEAKIGRRLQTQLWMLHSVSTGSYEYSSLSSCSLFSRESSRASPSSPKFCTQLKENRVYLKTSRTCAVEVLHIFNRIDILLGFLLYDFHSASVTWRDYCWVRLAVIPNSSVAVCLGSQTSTPGCTWRLIWCFLSDFGPKKNKHSHREAQYETVSFKTKHIMHNF